jgi:hypothetical protein
LADRRSAGGNQQWASNQTASAPPSKPWRVWARRTTRDGDDADRHLPPVRSSVATQFERPSAIRGGHR